MPSFAQLEYRIVLFSVANLTSIIVLLCSDNVVMLARSEFSNFKTSTVFNDDAATQGFVSLKLFTTDKKVKLLKHIENAFPNWQAKLTNFLLNEVYNFLKLLFR